ncbi:MAG: PAS domain S-box protein [Actinomycetota bacterium]|nr:PAS domain S-box protein [Actinomycetota bacterium]
MSYSRAGVQMSVPLRILIVEDSENDALLLLRELRRGGYKPDNERVDTAADMEAALEKRDWDLVISDHSMPSFSSSAALEILQRKGLDLPFIIVSGQIGEDAAVAAMKAGAHDYIMKDNLARLNTAIERELREAEVRRERRQAEEKYRSIFENAVEGIFQTTADGRFLTANPALARMYGYGSPEELLTTVSNIEDQLYVDPERRAEFNRVVQQHDIVSGFEIQIYRKDGSVMWASVSARAVRNASGELLGYEGTVEDITERKRAEEALHEIREAERRRIARDLHDEAMQDLAFVLQSLQFAQLTSGDRGQDDRLGQEIAALRRVVAGLRNAVYDLRLGSEDRSLLRSLESLIELNRQMAPERELELVVEENFSTQLTGAMRTELSRIVQEALVNVRRHSGATWARVTLGHEGDEVWIEIVDNGRGFEPRKSAGIGLTGMQERVGALGGKLEIWSKPGEGTRVTLRVALPTNLNSNA